MGLPWYKRNMRKYRDKTSKISLMEHGAYNLLLDEYYINGPLLVVEQCSSNAQLLPDHSDLYRLCKCTTAEERSAVDAVIRRFFVLHNDGCYHNKEADEVIEEQQEKHNTRVRVGRQNRAKGLAKQCSSNARSNAPQKKDIRIKEDTSVSSSPVVPTVEIGMLFQNFWNEYPGRGKDGAIGNGFKGSRAKAQEKFTAIIKNLKGDENHEEFCRKLSDSLGKYTKFLDETGQPAQHAATWLNQRRWQDEFDSTGPAGPAGSGQHKSRNRGSVSSLYTLAMADKTYQPAEPARDSDQYPERASDPGEL